MWITVVTIIGLRASRLERPATWLIAATFLTFGLKFLSVGTTAHSLNRSTPWNEILRLFEKSQAVSWSQAESETPWDEVWNERFLIMEGLNRDTSAIVALAIGVLGLLKKRMTRWIGLVVAIYGLSGILFPILYFSIGTMFFEVSALHTAAWIGMSSEPVRTILLGLYLWFFLKNLHEGPNHPTCRSCGYNMTGNTSGRCPECGLQVGWALRTIDGR